MKTCNAVCIFVGVGEKQLRYDKNTTVADLALQMNIKSYRRAKGPTRGGLVNAVCIADGKRVTRRKLIRNIKNTDCIIFVTALYDEPQGRGDKWSIMPWKLNTPIGKRT